MCRCNAFRSSSRSRLSSLSSSVTRVLVCARCLNGYGLKAWNSRISNLAMGEEVRRTLVDLDEVEKELKKAANAIDAAAGLTGKYRVRLQVLCDGPDSHNNKMPRRLERSGVRGVTGEEIA
jgi:hypothetical protein